MRERDAARRARKDLPMTIFSLSPAPSAALAVDALLLVALTHAVVTDLRARRISNRLTYPLMLIGLLANTATGGWTGFSGSGLGLLAGLGIMLIPFVLGAMGAGDVKLMAAIGALKGPEFVFTVAVYGSLVGGLIALFYLVRERRLGATVRYLSFGFLPALQGKGQKAGSIPYAPAIAAGALIALLPWSLASAAPFTSLSF
jgi:prepilin peptidase CpaA